MKDDHLNEPDPLERILRSMTNADDLRALALFMAEKAMNDFKRVCEGLSDDDLRKGILDGSLGVKCKALSDSEFDATMRRWLIEKGYL